VIPDREPRRFTRPARSEDRVGVCLALPRAALTIVSHRVGRGGEINRMPRNAEIRRRHPGDDGERTKMTGAPPPVINKRSKRDPAARDRRRLDSRCGAHARRLITRARYEKARVSCRSNRKVTLRPQNHRRRRKIRTSAEWRGRKYEIRNPIP